jgi:urease gamma subunit
MINVKAKIEGEPDVPPFIRVFEYRDKSDDLIFYSMVERIKEKLARNLKINTNESLLFYCAYVVSELHSHKSIDSIEKNASRILSTDKVMIGVPETLRKITFEAVVDNMPKKQIITFNEPIPTSSYILTATKKQKTKTTTKL